MMVNYISDEHGLGIEQACRILNFSRSSYYYQSHGRNDEELIRCLEILSAEHPGYGFRKMYHLLRKGGHLWNHKRVYRVYKALGLNLVRKRKRRLPQRDRCPLEVPSCINEVWSIDFMSDSLFNGRKFRTLNVIDDYNREALWIEIGLSIGSKHLTDLLSWIVKERGKPRIIRTDNGPEFTSRIFTQWCFQAGIQIRYIQPGKPMQNGFIERFNRSYRNEILDSRIFDNLIQVREQTYKWMEHYNENRPHESLGNLAPRQYLLKEKNSTRVFSRSTDTILSL